MSVCNHCGKGFSYSGYLKQHVKVVHEGVRDHVCNHCKKGFSKSRDLKKHVKAVHEKFSLFQNNAKSDHKAKE